MKKIIKFIAIVFLSFGLFAQNVFAAANTLGDLKKELANLKAEKSAYEASKNKTQSEINAENAKISNAYKEVEKAQNDIDVAKKQIEDSKNKIANLKEESSKLLVFYEVMQGESSFVEYVSGATSINEMIIRMDAIDQILTYNQNNLKSLQELIEKNMQLEVDLKKREIELNEAIKEYEKELKSLKANMSSLVEVALDIDTQITSQQKLIAYYEQVGCKDNDLLSKCVDVASSPFFMKPTVKGYISSGFGYRSFYLNGAPYSDFHPGVDVAGNSGGTAVYAVANGTVAAVISKSSCGGNQVFLHVRVAGVAYTIQYAHLLEYYVKVGDSVTQNTIIGAVGGGGKTLKSNGGWDTCSTGYHLHFGVAKGFYLGGGPEGYSSFNKFVSSSITPPFMPAYGKWYYSRI